MRIERLRQGIRVRCLFNRGELREHVRRALREAGHLPTELEAVATKAIPLFITTIVGGNHQWRPGPDLEGSSLLITHRFLQQVCQRMAAERETVPGEVEFTVGLGENGQVAGATLAWWELEGEG